MNDKAKAIQQKVMASSSPTKDFQAQLEKQLMQRVQQPSIAAKEGLSIANQTISSGSMLSTGPQANMHQVPHGPKPPNQQPRFIRKKPQVIQSIEFSQEIAQPSQEMEHAGKLMSLPPNSLFSDDEELRLAQPPAIDQQKQRPEQVILQQPMVLPQITEQTEHSQYPAENNASTSPPQFEQNTNEFFSSKSSAAQEGENEEQRRNRIAKEMEEEQKIIEKMMMELKLKKQQLMLGASASFGGGGGHSTERTTSNGPSILQPQMSLSPECKPKKSTYGSGQGKNSQSPSPTGAKSARNNQQLKQEYEELKQKKLNELKSLLVNDKPLEKKAIMPYATTISKAGEEEYKSESTVQYLNESEVQQQLTVKQTLDSKRKVNQPPPCQRQGGYNKPKPQTSMMPRTPSKIEKQQTQQETRRPIQVQNPHDKRFSTLGSNEQTRNNRNLTPYQEQRHTYQQENILQIIPEPVIYNPPQDQIPIKLIPSPINNGDHQLLSDKSQHIVFKKLQKDVEIAIRNADYQSKGSLNMDELKRCFFNLEYLPFLQSETKQFQFGSQRNHITTNKGIVLQEKEFLYNFWCILNPLNLGEIDNALLYDVLLLMIYNVQHTIQTTVVYISEYLENLYKELGVDLNNFQNYYISTSSVGQTAANQGVQDDNSEQRSGLSNLNKYLSFNNLWCIEKLASEFRQIHANKVSYHIASTKQQRTVPPVQLQSPQSNNNQSPNILVNPSDGRKYKKQVIEDHLSQLTFSPTLSSKTKKIDTKITERLKLENSKTRRNNANYLKREASADLILGGQQSRVEQYYDASNALDDSQIIEEESNNEFAQNGPNGFKRYDLLVYRQQLAQEKIDKAKKEKLEKALEECTFQPNSQRNLGGLIGSKSYQNLQNQTNKAFKEITSKIRDQKSRIHDPTQASRAQHQTYVKPDKELEECTFKPNIISKTPKHKENTSGYGNNQPKGYYEMINRIRKVTEEKKALEEKFHKKAIGENYDKVKLMNLKPPSFLQEDQKQQRNRKRKLLMYVDVNITPTRTGRIGIYEGDEVRELARNFQKTFQLNNTMAALLVQQLEQHLLVYKERNGLTGIEGTTFPVTTSHEERNGVPSEQLERLTFSQESLGGKLQNQNLHIENHDIDQDDKPKDRFLRDNQRTFQQFELHQDNYQMINFMNLHSDELSPHNLDLSGDDTTGKYRETLFSQFKHSQLKHPHEQQELQFKKSHLIDEEISSGVNYQRIEDLVPSLEPAKQNHRRRPAEPFDFAGESPSLQAVQKPMPGFPEMNHRDNSGSFY